MYFCLVYADGDQCGRLSAPPLPTPASRSKDWAFFGGYSVDLDRSDKSKEEREKECLVTESKEDQVFRFWDEEANGKLVQAPLDLDRLGRGWCEVRCDD